MADSHRRAFDQLLETYFSLGDSAVTIARRLKRIPNLDTRDRLIAELVSLDEKRIEVLKQMADLKVISSHVPPSRMGKE